MAHKMKPTDEEHPGHEVEDAEYEAPPAQETGQDEDDAGHGRSDDPTPLQRAVRPAFYAVAIATATTGLWSMLTWLIPHLTPGLLPAALVRFFDKAGGDGLVTTHVVLGILLVLAIVASTVLWLLGFLRWNLPDPGMQTATSAFFHWVFGWFEKDRVHRPRLRDMLVWPLAELEMVAAIALVSIALAAIPLDPVNVAGRLLHRTNAIYAGMLGVHSVLVLVLKRRGESPHPTVIREGRLVRRPVHYD